MRRFHVSQRNGRVGFSLVEVMLAIGVLAVAVLALLGLFGPTVSQVREVVDASQASAVKGRIQAYLDNIAFTSAGGEPNVWDTVQNDQPLFYFDAREIVTDGSNPVSRFFLLDGVDDPIDLASISPANFTVSGRTYFLEGNIHKIYVDQSPLADMSGSAADFEEGYLPVYIEVYSYDIDHPELTAAEAPADRPRDRRVLAFTTAVIRDSQ